MMKNGKTNDGYDTPVRMYDRFRQTHGKQGIKIYVVEFLDKGRWTEWMETPDEKEAIKEFETLTGELKNE